MNGDVNNLLFPESKLGVAGETDRKTNKTYLKKYETQGQLPAVALAVLSGGFGSDIPGPNGKS